MLNKPLQRTWGHMEGEKMEGGRVGRAGVEEQEERGGKRNRRYRRTISYCPTCSIQPACWWPLTQESVSVLTLYQDNPSHGCQYTPCMGPYLQWAEFDQRIDPTGLSSPQHSCKGRTTKIRMVLKLHFLSHFTLCLQCEAQRPPHSCPPWRLRGEWC